MVTEIAENIAKIREAVSSAAARSGRAASEIKLMGVTKFHPLAAMEEASPLLDLIGENRVQEAAEKRASWTPGLPSCPWHMIGRLQKNKIRRAIEIFDLIESVDSYETASAVNRIAAEKGLASYPVFLEINISGEETKGGVSHDAAFGLLDAILTSCPSVDVRGLMTVARETDDEQELRNTFASLRMLRDALRASSGLPLPELSMGMSGDFTAAIEEGSTIVRIGSAIFGKRNYNGTKQ
ncbi:MAG: YggS family pyridoxal phosphate-dependent enzyme [Synergistes sp.]|nr:YggS family pyridoxal phosphate-dependent enzyme [Synergistes sp.]